MRCLHSDSPVIILKKAGYFKYYALKSKHIVKFIYNPARLWYPYGVF